MGQVLTIMIFVALGINVMRLIRRPSWRLLFSFPFWIYLAWGHLGPGETNRWVAAGLFVLLLVGYGVLWSRSGGTLNDESEDGEGLEGGREDEDLEFRLEVEDVGPNWRDSFPSEKEVFERLERLRAANALRRLDEEPISVALPELQTEELIEPGVARLRRNVDEYVAGERGLDDFVRSMDLLTALEPGAGYGVLKRVLDSVPNERVRADLPEILTGMIWSRYCPQGPVPPEVVEAVDEWFDDGNEKTKESILRWKTLHDVMNWEVAIPWFKQCSPVVLSRFLFDGVPTEVQGVLLRSILDRFEIRGDGNYSRDEEKIVSNIAYAIRRRNGRLPDESFSQSAAGFLTEVFGRAPLSLFHSPGWRRNWEKFCHDVDTPEAQSLKRRVIALGSDDDRSVARAGENGGGELLNEHALRAIINDAVTGLAGEFPEESVRLILNRIEDGRLPHQTHEMAKRHERFRQLMIEAFQSQYAHRAGDPRSKLQLERFLIQLSDPKELKFLMERAEQVEKETLAQLAWRTVRVNSLDAARELQRRGLIIEDEILMEECEYDLERCLGMLGHPHVALICSDSDERPPRYDNAIRRLSEISQDGFPAERARIRVIEGDELRLRDRIEVSWYLLEKKFSFQVDYAGDFLDVFSLFQGVNESLKSVGSSKLFLAFGDDNSCLNFVFGDQEAWREAAEEFCLRLYVVPEIDGSSDEIFREVMLRKVSEFLACEQERKGFSNT